MINIGIIREEKIPIDRRAPISPNQAKKIQLIFPKVKIKIQSSDIRCYTNDEYKREGIEVVENLNNCDYIFGIKEVPVNNLIENKTYFFFAHIIKKQIYNRKLLQTILSKNIKFIDYEVIKDKNNVRVIAFGRWAGIVGTYNALWTFGNRYNIFHLKRAKDCENYEELLHELNKVILPNIKIVLTGGGRVSKGAMEILYFLKYKKVNPIDFLNKDYNQPVFCQLNPEDYHFHKKTKEFNLYDFYSNPENYNSNFVKYTNVADMLISGSFWSPKAPVMFTKEDTLKPEFHTSVIADISCDLNGPIPSTKRASTIEDPVYDYNPYKDEVTQPFSDESFITVMAVDNLPCELPRDSSEEFGNIIINKILPNLFIEDKDQMLERATITEKGALTPLFSYLQDFADGN